MSDTTRSRELAGNIRTGMAILAGARDRLKDVERIRSLENFPVPVLEALEAVLRKAVLEIDEPLWRLNVELGPPFDKRPQL